MRADSVFLALLETMFLKTAKFKYMTMITMIITINGVIIHGKEIKQSEMQKMWV